MRFGTDSIGSRAMYWIGVFLLFWSCRNGDSASSPDGSDLVNKVTIELNDKKQVIRNFGASDAWTCQYIGKWPDAKRQQIARWLFSRDFDSEGNPKGIGLSLWRFNVGAGSSGQVSISDPWRRTECFLTDKGIYNWNNQEGQQWFLRAAQSYGVDKFVAFTNSPPISMTKNGDAFSGNANEANLPVDKYNTFATFLTDVLEHFKNDGIPFDYVSPFNEPQWDWTGNGQEGSPYRNTEIFRVTRILDSLLEVRGLPTKVQIAEAGKLNYLYEVADKPGRGDQIHEFFNAQSDLYVGGLSHVDKIISGHSYFTSSPNETLREVRTNLAGRLGDASISLEFWQSEYCILGSQEEVKAEGKDMGMDPALYVAKIIHHDLTVANASAWHWWLAVSVYDYKDGLIYADKNTADGNVQDTKLLWALGNFSRFVRPGAIRLGVTLQNLSVDNPRGIMLSSFIHPESSQLTVVAINYSNNDVTTLLEISDHSAPVFKAYLTGPGEDEKLKASSEVVGGQKLTIPKRSIITLVTELN